MQTTADDIVKALRMRVHSEEGGMFLETFRSIVHTKATKERRAATSILYMLKGREISRWHMVRSDEIWMYHAGTPGIQMLLFPDGTFQERVIGPDVTAGEFPQSVIPAWTYQSTVLADRSEDRWGLFGAVCSPGFEYVDFQSARTEDLILKYPGAKERILELGL